MQKKKLFLPPAPPLSPPVSLSLLFPFSLSLKVESPPRHELRRRRKRRRKETKPRRVCAVQEKKELKQFPQLFFLPQGKSGFKKDVGWRGRRERSFLPPFPLLSRVYKGIYLSRPPFLPQIGKNTCAKLCSRGKNRWKPHMYCTINTRMKQTVLHTVYGAPALYYSRT